MVEGWKVATKQLGVQGIASDRLGDELVPTTEKRVDTDRLFMEGQRTPPVFFRIQLL